MSSSINRTSLYEMVWDKPVTKVADRLGISDVALHKICRKHDIPVPPRGHWAKLAAGKSVKVTALPKNSSNSITLIQILGSATQNLSESVLQAQRKARTREAEESQTCSDESLAAISNHVKRLRKKLESAKPNKDGYVRLIGNNQFNTTVTPATRERAVMALENIINATIASGYKLTPSKSGLAIEIEGELVALAITEPTQRKAHEPTAAEAARLDRWRRANDQKMPRGEWVSPWGKPDIPEFDEVPSGQLLVEVDPSQSWDGIRRRFRDGKRQRVENLSKKIVTAAAVCAVAAIERREESVRREREDRELNRQRQEFERRRILEEKRWEFLEGKMLRLEKAQLLERFVSDYTAHYGQQSYPKSYQKLIEWASNAAALIRSEISPDNLASILDKHNLMDDACIISSWVRIAT